MALRIFQDASGRTWHVWGVPSTPNVQAQLPPADRAGRWFDGPRVGPEWAGGWLAFETTGEKRRLAPYPPDWNFFSDDELAALCNKAHLVRPSRPFP